MSRLEIIIICVRLRGVKATATDWLSVSQMSLFIESILPGGSLQVHLLEPLDREFLCAKRVSLDQSIFCKCSPSVPLWFTIFIDQVFSWNRRSLVIKKGKAGHKENEEVAPYLHIFVMTTIGPRYELLSIPANRKTIFTIKLPYTANWSSNLIVGYSKRSSSLLLVKASLRAAREQWIAAKNNESSRAVGGKRFRRSVRWLNGIDPKIAVI